MCERKGYLQGFLEVVDVWGGGGGGKSGTFRGEHSVEDHFFLGGGGRLSPNNRPPGSPDSLENIPFRPAPNGKKNRNTDFNITELNHWFLFKFLTMTKVKTKKV